MPCGNVIRKIDEMLDMRTSLEKQMWMDGHHEES